MHILKVAALPSIGFLSRHLDYINASTTPTLPGFFFDGRIMAIRNYSFSSFL